jgi:predicted MFS family arabinose efflux permease
MEIGMAAVGSVFNAGIAGGAFLGGVLLDGPGLRVVPLVAMALAASACLTLVVGTRNDHPRRVLAVSPPDVTRVTESV